eukprot:Pgem_evm1s4629
MIIKEGKIIITHSTENLVETSLFLAADLELFQSKLIILTGSFVPYSFHDSDAEFNIGVSIAACNLLQNGVYIAMNGLIVPAHTASRERSGLFVNESMQLASSIDNDISMNNDSMNDTMNDTMNNTMNDNINYIMNDSMNDNNNNTMNDTMNDAMSDTLNDTMSDQDQLAGSFLHEQEEIGS